MPRVVKRNIPLVLTTDTGCHWAPEVTRHALMVEACEVWHSFSVVSSLFSLIVADVSKGSGDAMDRPSEINEPRKDLVGYLGAASGRPPKHRQRGCSPAFGAARSVQPRHGTPDGRPPSLLKYESCFLGESAMP